MKHLVRLDIHMATVYMCEDAVALEADMFGLSSVVSLCNAPCLTICEGRTVTPGTALENCADRVLVILTELALDTTVTRKDAVLWRLTDRY